MRVRPGGVGRIRARQVGKQRDQCCVLDPGRMENGPGVAGKVLLKQGGS